MREKLLLERKLNEAFVLLNISPVQRLSLKTYLNLIELKDEATYCHCIRVALYGVRIAELLDLDQKAIFYSGLLHDVGKVLIDKELLTKIGNFSEADYREMKKHSLYGYYLLKGAHDFSAEVILRHHRSASGGYPKRFPRPKIAFSPETKAAIDCYAQILAIIDFYDAAITRKNGKFNGKSARALLNRHFPEEIAMIDLCYKEGIFGE